MTVRLEAKDTYRTRRWLYLSYANATALLGSGQMPQNHSSLVAFVLAGAHDASR